ncbi:MAG: hypothetical protein EOM64_01640 [Erysipelotrichia bacterium]|nr:hypothetical protein [Erysipelotrichia bacterium]
MISERKVNVIINGIVSTCMTVMATLLAYRDGARFLSFQTVLFWILGYILSDYFYHKIPVESLKDIMRKCFHITKDTNEDLFFSDLLVILILVSIILFLLTSITNMDQITAVLIIWLKKLPIFILCTFFSSSIAKLIIRRLSVK